MGGVGAPQIAQNPLHFAFLRKGHRHVEMQPDHVAVEIRRGQ